MVCHPFVAAVESGASRDQLATFFAADVSFHAPMLTSPEIFICLVLAQGGVGLA
jgi:hypothetical protein